jgi:hypothetical protein
MDVHLDLSEKMTPPAGGMASPFACRTLASLRSVSRDQAPRAFPRRVHLKFSWTAARLAGRAKDALPF